MNDLLKLLVHLKILILNRFTTTVQVSWKRENYLELLEQLEQSRAKFFLRKWVAADAIVSARAAFTTTDSTLEKASNSQEVIVVDDAPLSTPQKNLDLPNIMTHSGSSLASSFQKKDGSKDEHNGSIETLDDSLLLTQHDSMKLLSTTQIFHTCDLPEFSWLRFLSFLPVFELL